MAQRCLGAEPTGVENAVACSGPAATRCSSLAPSVRLFEDEPVPAND